MKIVTVIPFKGIPGKDDLTYFSSKELKISDIVTIEVRNKKTLGLVISVEELDELKIDIKRMPFNLKKVLDVKEHSIFDERFLDTISKTSEYFLVSKSKVAEILIPSEFKNSYDKISEFAKNVFEKRTEKKDNLKLEKLLLQYPPLERISIYKTLIRGNFAEKKSVFIVLPGENHIENFQKELSKGIENFTISLHSGLNSKKIQENIKNIITSDHPILILGTPPYLSIPRKDIATVILEQESSSSYRTIKKPNFDLRTFVEIFAENIKAKLIFADTLLRFETIGRKELENIGELYPLSFRTNFKGNILINKNIRKEHEKEFRIFNDEITEEIERSLEKNKKIFIFSLRKGLATHTVCRDCGEVVICKKCFSPLVLYLSKDKVKRMFVCNKCGKQTETDIKCERCKSWNLHSLGIGTDTVFSEISKYFKKNENVKVFKIDKESANTEKKVKRIIKDFEKETKAILIGTEMVIPYISEQIDTSIISSFNSLWNIPSFRVTEKIIKILLSLIYKTENKIIIQTRDDKEPIIQSMLEENFGKFVKEEIEERKNLKYPPFYKFIKITYIGDKKNTENARNFLREEFSKYNPEVFSGFIQKQKEKYITNALIRVKNNEWSVKNDTEQNDLRNKLISISKDFIITIDPEDLL